MRNSLLLLSVMGAAAAVAMPAHAESYLQVNAGFGFSGEADLTARDTTGSASLTQDLDGGFVGSAAYGQTLMNGVSIEAELIYQASDVKTPQLDAFFGTALDVNEKVYGVLANAKYQFTPTSKISPYVGVGAGFGNVTYELLGDSDDKSGFMWQALAGITFKTSETTSIDVGYRYLSLPQWEFSDASLGVSADIDTAVHVGTIGLRFGF